MRGYAPVACYCLIQNVLDDKLERRSRNTLAEPFALHLGKQFLNQPGPSPIHDAECQLTSSVGTAQTLKLYGLMNRSARATPIMRRIHSSKFLGLTLEIARTVGGLYVNPKKLSKTRKIHTLSSINHAFNASSLLSDGQHGDIVLRPCQTLILIPFREDQNVQRTWYG